MDRTETNSDNKLALALSAGEKKLIEKVTAVNPDVVAAVQQATKKSVQLSITQLDELADALSGEANHTDGIVLQGKIDKFVRRIDQLTGSHLRASLDTKGSKH
jgi:hypothetical protein